MNGDRYTENDFVTVVDDNGVVQENKIPKAWIGTDLAPGLKKAGRKAASSDPGAEPAGNASTEDWAAYARTQGATDADLVDADGEPLGRDELRAKYGSGS